MNTRHAQGVCVKDLPRAFVQRDLDETEIPGLIDVLLTPVDVGVRKPEAVG